MTHESRRTFWDDASAFHARIPVPKSATEAWLAIDAAAADAGLLAEGEWPVTECVPGRDRRRSYRLPGAPRAFRASVFEEASVGWHLLISPAFDTATDQDEADALSSFAAKASARTGALVGRSFSYVDTAGYVTPEEVGGELRWIDWLQYFGPEVVSRFGIERLRLLPAFTTQQLPGGAVFIRATRLPTETFSRKEPASILGISLRPLRIWNHESQTWTEREWPW